MTAPDATGPGHRPSGIGEGGPAPAIFFLSDYGTADEFVGVVHSVLHRLAPTRPVIDLSHQIPPFDVAAGGAMLVRCAPFLGAGVVLAVVDPGVGTSRRGVAIGVTGDGPRWLVGPDNGLLMPMAALLGGVDRAIVLDRRRSSPHRTGSALWGNTFDGRDVFAPAAAHLIMGGTAEALGTGVDPSSLATASAPPPHHDRFEPSPDGSAVVTTVAWVDRFGNVQLRLRPEVLEGLGLPVGGTALVTVEGEDGPPGDGDPPRPARRPTEVRRVSAFGELAGGELGLALDSSGRIALVVDRASAALLLRIRGPGETVRISTRHRRDTGP